MSDFRRGNLGSRASHSVLGLVCAFSLACLARPSFGDVSFGQLDDFLSGTGGWVEGAPSPNPPVRVSDGGPGGAGDPYLLNVASGGFGAGSKQIMFNQSQWTGDYAAAKITRVTLQLANFGTTPLSIRLAFTGGSNRFCSNDAVALPANSGWLLASFDLKSSKFTALDGAGVVEDSLQSVTEVRILSAAGGPAYNGDGIASSLGVDSIRALCQPGDATFDGLVNFNDLVVLAQNYNHVGKASWGTGDFTFDNQVNFDDLVVLAQNYNAGSVVGNGVENIGGAAFAADWALASSLVPEPGVALLVAGSLLGARRRRRLAAVCC